MLVLVVPHWIAISSKGSCLKKCTSKIAFSRLFKQLNKALKLSMVSFFNNTTIMQNNDTIYKLAVAQSMSNEYGGLILSQAEERDWLSSSSERQS